MTRKPQNVSPHDLLPSLMMSSSSRMQALSITSIKKTEFVLKSFIVSSATGNATAAMNQEIINMVKSGLSQCATPAQFKAKYPNIRVNNYSSISRIVALQNSKRMFRRSLGQARGKPRERGLSTIQTLSELSSSELKILFKLEW